MKNADTEAGHPAGVVGFGQVVPVRMLCSKNSTGLCYNDIDLIDTLFCRKKASTLPPKQRAELVLLPFDGSRAVCLRCIAVPAV